MFKESGIEDAPEYMEKLTKFYKFGNKTVVFLIDCSYDCIDYLDYLKMLFGEIIREKMSKKDYFAFYGFENGLNYLCKEQNVGNILD
jgi:hypothetical protein